MVGRSLLLFIIYMDGYSNHHRCVY